MSRSIAALAFVGALLFALLVVSRRGRSAPPFEDTTRIVAIHPSTSTIPANLLRFHIEFSAPMQPGESRVRLRLTSDDGQVIEGAFLEAVEELWDPDFTRLTVLLDPGRIKRGLRSHREMGTQLTIGSRYRLVVDSSWRDARGVPLGSTTVREYAVVVPDRQPPQPHRWSILAPHAGTRDTLRVSFEGVLDHASVPEAISIYGPEGLLRGDAALVARDSAMVFVPAEPWSSGAHHVHVAMTLEDPSGNSVARPFDVDGIAGETMSRDQDVTIRLRFTPRPR